MLKNLDVKTLLLSKTLWGAIVAAIPMLIGAAATWKTDKASAINQAVSAIGLILAAIGLKDATSGPVN